VKTVRCPHCHREVEWSERRPQRPFCSERCRLIDLGAWADEAYRIAGREIPPPPGQDKNDGPDWVN